MPIGGANRVVPLPALAMLLALGVVPQGRREPVEPAPAPERPRPPAAARVQHPAAPVIRRKIEGRLSDEWGIPLGGWSVTLVQGMHELGYEEPRRQVRTDPRGRFALDLPTEPGLAFLLRSPDGSTVALREDFRLDGREIDLRVGPEDRATAFVEGRLVGPGGSILRDPKFGAWSELPSSYRLEWEGDRFRLGPFVPGKYSLSALVERLPPLVRVLTVEADGVRDLGTLQLEPPGWIRVNLAHPGIELGWKDMVRTELLLDGRIRMGSVRNGPAAEETPVGMCAFATPLRLPPRSLSEPLVPGRYLLRTHHERGFAPDVTVDVVPGETTEVDLTLVPATRRTLVLRVPPEDPAIRLGLRITSEDGAFTMEREHGYRSKLGFVEDVDGLLPGRYRVEIRSPTRGAMAAGFEVLDLSDAPVVQLDPRERD